ncbi:uncharacterized protein LOC134848279 isoform X2 [Symsagittifera roscoffensis]
MLVDGLIVCPVNLLCLICRFHYPIWEQFGFHQSYDNNSDNNGSDSNNTNNTYNINSADIFRSDKAGCYLTAVYNGANITTTSPVLLFLCVERALLILCPIDGKIMVKRFRMRLFVTVNIGTSLIYTSLLFLGTNFDTEAKTCDLTLLGLNRTVSAFIFVIMFYLVPLSAMVILYPMIAKSLLTNRIPLPAYRVAINKRISTLLMISTAAFALLWAPLMIPSLWQAIDTDSFDQFSIKNPFIFKVYAVCNLSILLYSVVNPCIFAMITRPIREPLLNEAVDLIARRTSHRAKSKSGSHCDPNNISLQPDSPPNNGYRQSSV